jgi:ABC-type multidrug transport system fused ATPase/permease subunit
MYFTINLSKTANAETMKRLLKAPVDKFFDRTPVGRIMNRMTTDLVNIDLYTYNNITGMISVLWINSVPLVYLHVLMPMYFTIACIPFYYLMFLLLRKFWNTMVPTRYLLHISKSWTDTALTEVDNSNSFVRASGKGNFKFKEFQRVITNQIKADVATSTFLKRWLVNRLFLMMGFFVCSMVIISIWVPGVIAVGGVGLCLANMFQLIATVETDIESAMRAQFQFISMKRLHDYTELPQEAAWENEGDLPYKSYCVYVERAKLGLLERRNTESGMMIVRTSNGKDEWMLEQAENNMFRAPDGFVKLDPSNPQLQQCQGWHRLVAVNGKCGSPGGVNDPGMANAKIGWMVNELCNGKGDWVMLQIQSGWLLSGARVVIEDLVAGYGDIARDVLQGINIEIEPRTKVGIVGTTGCGKSTLLLCLLRILESRSGKILINGVNTQSLGLKTLRTTIGMVAQDPVLMQCSVRDNIDPFGQFDDEALWKGLDMVQMKDRIASLPNGLQFQIQADGNNLSYGQRQLLCMARMVIRQPALILLDEATSALDPATQQQVQLTMERHFPESTLIMIAHRLETIANFDQVAVMERGTITEQGPPNELKNEGGTFAKMWAAKQTW